MTNILHTGKDLKVDVIHVKLLRNDENKEN